MLTYDTEIKGSPFLFEDWRLAKIKLKSVGEYDNIKVKYSPHYNKFYYNQNDSLYEFSDNLEEVRLKNNEHLEESGYDMIFREDVSADGIIMPGKFVQVLTKGKVTLVKQYIGKIDKIQKAAPLGAREDQGNLLPPQPYLQ